MTLASYSFQILGTSRQFRFKVNTIVEFRDWIEAINEHIAASVGKQVEQMKIVKKPEFWKIERISET